MAINRLKGKRILITAGPTWVAIDSVRVISNIASGETGILLAERLRQLGARVTLLLGQVPACCLNKRIRLVRYKFFQELKEKITQELRTKQYDAVIHSAAVSDYRPQNFYRHKVKSGLKNWQLSLQPTEKIINLIKKIDPNLLAVGFKFQPQAKKSILLQEAQRLMEQSGVDLVVANTLINGKYRAYVCGRCCKLCATAVTKKQMVNNLIKAIKG